VLEIAGIATDPALLEGWRARVQRARRHLGWPEAELVVRLHPGGATLALAAPFDLLFTATEVNEWALCAALLEREPERWPDLEAALVASQPEALLPAVLDETLALMRLTQLAAAEARPDIRRLVELAAGHGTPLLLDETTLTLGEGAHGRSWPLFELPRPEAIPWNDLRSIPVAVVTGSNGKTTVVRLLAACAAAQGWPPGYSCTEGLFIGEQALDAGDYSGPVGTRTILRDPRVHAAILETARGGILRRGLALGRADAAIVTNISADHFGEYGIHDLESLAAVKLTVAHVVHGGGLVVLNADDATLRKAAAGLPQRLGWFALDYGHEALLEHRAGGGSTCGMRNGRLLLSHGDAECDLGPVAAMPLSIEGSATYNVANLAAAALGAIALCVTPANVAAVFASFGARPTDNVGRLMRYDIGGVRLLVDYAHNPAGIRGLFRVVEHLRGDGRIAVLLGQAGNREDADLRDLAAAVASFGPDLVVIKEELDYLRGRAPGEVPAILKAALLQAGLPESAIAAGASDSDAARRAIAWSRPGDVLALLMHSRQARTELLALFDRMQQTGWEAGQPLPG
jgi:cyanophycin synthetase